MHLWDLHWSNEKGRNLSAFNILQKFNVLWRFIKRRDKKIKGSILILLIVEVLNLHVPFPVVWFLSFQTKGYYLNGDLKYLQVQLMQDEVPWIYWALVCIAWKLQATSITSGGFEDTKINPRIRPSNWIFTIYWCCQTKRLLLWYFISNLICNYCILWYSIVYCINKQLQSNVECGSPVWNIEIHGHQFHL